MTNNTFDSVKIKFEKFLSLISNVLTCEKEIHIIQNKLRRHFNTTISDYLCSNEFLTALEHIQNHFNINNKSTKYYTLLASFDEQLKKHSIKSSKSTSSPITISTSIINNPTTTSNIEYEFSVSEVQETIEYILDQCCNILYETPVIDQVTSIPIESNVKSQHQRKISRLERRLNRLSKIIRELEEKDMSLDEMAHCDLYEVESNLKKQACQIHTKLSKLKSQSSSAERILYQPIILNESEIGHPLINKDLQEMVNQSKNFPTFNDVLETVEKANDKHKLNLNEEARKNFAEKSFKIIGKEIKNRRMADFQDIMYSRLPEDFNIEQSDPALNNAEIEQVLLENQREAVIKTEKIFEEFSRIEPDPNGEINIDSAEEEEEEQQQMEIDHNHIEQPIISLEPLIPIESESNSIENQLEISLNDRTLTILSTASLPIHNQDIETHIDSSSSSSAKESQIKTLIPRQKPIYNDNEIIYKLYQQRLTNSNNKRSLINNLENSNIKKSKQQPELIKERKKKLFSKNLSTCVVSSTASIKYFFLVRHGIYLSTSDKDDGLIELGRQQAYAAAETINILAHSLENSSSRILFTNLIQSGYKRAYQTGFITGHRLEEMQRLEQSFDNIYKRFKCWGEIHSIECFRERWIIIQRLFFSSSVKSSKNYVIFSHGNLLSSIISFLMSNASWNQWTFGNIAPHCSVSVLSYKSGDLYPKIVFKPFQILNQTLPKTINNVNPKKMRLKEILTNKEINEQTWKIIIDSIIPERVAGIYTDQISLISKFIPGNQDEARHILFIFKQYYSQIITTNDKYSTIDQNSDSDDEAEDEDDDEED